MVFDALAGSVILALGIFLVYRGVNDATGRDFAIMMLLGLAGVIGGLWILISKLTLAVVLVKLAGIIMAAIGGFLVIEFPDVDQYQREGMSVTGIVIGLVLLIFGLYLFVFA